MRVDLGSLQLGVATAATQIEGGHADTNWHRWAAQPGRIKDGSTPARAADHWNRVDQDIALLGELGVRHYRMGLEWARLEPTPGQFDPGALQHYRDELTKLRDAGITPLVTLHHFNNPGWLEEKGAWLTGAALPAYLRFVRHIVTQLKDLVSEWITINEPNVYATEGYLRGLWPPGHNSLPETLRVMSHMAQAHGRAYDIIHALQPGARVGVAHHLRPFDPARRINPLDRLGAKVMELGFQTALLDAMTIGRFRFPLWGGTPGKLRRCADFIGVNYYERSWVRGVNPGTRPGCVTNDLGWEIYPEGLTRLLTHIAGRYPLPIYITENGTADATDAFRPRFIVEHLQAALASGAPVQRYYHWCFTDNWEWAEGEGPRFGLVELDYETQARTIRKSGRLYADMVAHGGLTDEAYGRWLRVSV
ncbi:MAG: glycoside hydrolase family 1 protein [Propionibacteriaceae bacterium]|jgi:beta-glucosidase|nr:glycoside hydrolase family 1 protein [Propionibacteriaceae bacterium]